MIASDADLAAACARWSAARVIGVDTEFVRERTYYPIPALLQVHDGDSVTMVDPLQISDFTPLAAVLADPLIVKLIHACSEDMEVLELLTGVTPRGILDTQLAGAFAGHGYSLGYRSLVNELLDVVLDKGETRSNWLGRPLTPAQILYAALDVEYLLPMHRRLSRELADLGRAPWLEEELEHQRRARTEDKQPCAAYVKVRRRAALSPAHHAVLRGLSQWRETEAMARDIPRQHLLRDEVLIALAKASDPDPASLGHIQGLSEGAAARYGEAIAACIETARQQGPADSDSPVDLRPYAGTVERLKRVARRAASALELPPELLASRRGIEALLISVLENAGDIPQQFQGWRFDVVTRSLLDCIHQSN
jgi:ribonuclease D